MFLRSLLLASIVFVAISANEIPDQFLGKWKLAHSDDSLDEYLKAKGLGWLTRNLVKISSITKTFEKNSDNTYNNQISTLNKELNYKNFKLGNSFTGDYLDDFQHSITFTYDPSTKELVEKHEYENDGKKIDVYKYKISADGYMSMHMEYNGVSTNRYYKKE